MLPQHLRRRMVVATIRSSGRSPLRRQLVLQLLLPLRRHLHHLRLPHHLHLPHLPPRKALHRLSLRHRTTPLLATTAKTSGDKKRTATTTVPTTKSTRRAIHATDSHANCLVLSSLPQVVLLRALNPPPRYRVGHRRILQRLFHRLHRRFHRHLPHLPLLLLLHRHHLWHHLRRPLPELQLHPETAERCSALSRAVRVCARLSRTTGAVLRSLGALLEMLHPHRT